jgi:hypothetical protein
MSAPRVAAAIVRQEAIALQSEATAAAYRTMAETARALGLTDEVERAERIAREFDADAAAVRAW